MSLKLIPLAAVVALGLGFGFSAPVYAMDEGVTFDQPTAVPAPTCAKDLIFDTKTNHCVAATTVVTCDKGFAYDADKKICVKTTALNDQDLYYQGRLLALAGHYDAAIDTLGAVGNKTSNVLTMIGYSARKMGNLDEGISIYYQALALDPRNLNTHEYLGEGYLAAGRVDLAEAELGTLQTLCGRTCVQYQTLSNALYVGTWN